MEENQNERKVFLEISAVLTGFEEITLTGTGVVSACFEKMMQVIGPQLSAEFFQTSAESIQLGGGVNGKNTEREVRRLLLSSLKFGPIARNIIQMWYSGVWIAMPPGWMAQYGITDSDADQVVSAAAYQEGLMWKVMGSHPQGAKQPGFGSWGLPPVQILLK